MDINELAWMLVAEVEVYLNRDDPFKQRFPWITAMHWSRMKGTLSDVEA